MRYRQESIFEVLAEKVVHKQLMDHLLQEAIIDKNQSGFMPGRCTGDAVFSLLKDLYTARNNGQRSAVDLLDMRKAFDTVDHMLLLRKLEGFNLGEEFVAWLRY